MSDKKARFIELVRERAYKEGTFTLASGRTSNFYINGKMVTLHPEGLALACELILEALAPEVQAIGGLTMGADPIIGGVTAMSWGAGRPVAGFMVRKEPKGHGTQSLIEGPLEAGQAVCIIEDTTTTGGSLLKAAKAAEAAGAKVVQCLTLVDRQEGGAEALSAEGYTLERLITLAEIRAAG
ncbi:MAG TPA: orotate phosphoribosyltransferase [Armatimonadota bacterium]|jgi:orotate phosphoribosyltransferase